MLSKNNSKLNVLIYIASLARIELGRALHHLKAKDPPNSSKMDLKIVIGKFRIKSKEFRNQSFHLLQMVLLLYL